MYDRILVPVDGSATSDKGVSEAIALARLTGGRIKLLHVYEAPMLGIGSEAALLRGEDVRGAARAAGRHVLAGAVASVKAAGVEVDDVLLDCEDKRLCDHVAQAAHAWNASLIVMGSHGRRGLQRLLLGSDAEQILRTAPVPVLLVRDRDTGAR
jgi:nucleotide-binding universal stress UspA family protein